MDLGTTPKHLYLNMPSRYGGIIHKLDLFDAQETCYTTWLDPENRNYHQWEPILRHLEIGNSVVLSGCNLKSRSTNIIDADSRVKIQGIVEPELEPDEKIYHELFA